MEGANLDGAAQHVVVKRSLLENRRGFNSMMTTYSQHGDDNLSIWLTNAKDAAAKIREATIRNTKEKQEKYAKFLKDLHLRVAESSKEKRVASAPTPPAKTCRLVGAHSDCNSLSILNVAQDTKDLLKQVSRMEDVRSFLESQLRKKARSTPTAKNGDPVRYRDCMARTGRVKTEEPQTRRKVSRKEEKPGVKNENQDIALAPIVRPFVVVIPTPPVPQTPELVMSEPCTPRFALDGWNIPTSFSSLDMRDVDEFVALPSTTSSKRESRVSETKVHPLVLPPSRNDRKDCEPKTFAQKLSARRNLHVNNTRTFCRAISSNLSMKCCDRIKSRLTNADHFLEKKLVSHTGGTAVPRISPSSPNLSRNRAESSEPVDCPSIPHANHSCSMELGVLRGRQEGEDRGQAKQSLSDVWKCTIDAERLYASERARMLSDVKKKRLKQLQIEKEQKAAMLKERALTRQRIAVHTHLELVATLKARREDVIKRNRILEKKRFADALRAIRIEKLQGYGLRVPPLCNCNHGEDPLNPEYIRKCQSNCTLRNNFPQYTAQLESTLQHLLEEICSELAAQPRARRSWNGRKNVPSA